MSRFDKAQERQKQAEAAATPKTNGKAKRESNGYAESSLSPPPSTNKRKADDSDELSEVEDSPKPKKVKKEKKPETDEEMARRLAQEENSRSARSTRGGGAKRKAAVTKAKKPKKKSSAKVNSDDDSAVESGDKPVKERKGGFHVRGASPVSTGQSLTVSQKPMQLSEPLADMLGESQLSRPQTVKQIWAYVKSRDMQDPSDKRQILCDEKMRAVFKSDKVHMFTMNKLLASHLYPVDEIVQPAV